MTERQHQGAGSTGGCEQGSPDSLVLNPCPLSSVPIVGFLVVIVQ